MIKKLSGKLVFFCLLCIIVVVSVCITNAASHKHSYTAKTKVAYYLRTKAACTAPATYYYKCSGCSAKGTTYYSTGKALGHSWGTASSVWSGNTSCTFKRICSRANCGAVQTAKTTTITKSTTKAATCTQSGVATYTAMVSSPFIASSKKPAVISALGHSFAKTNGTKEVSAATCTKAQTVKWKCSRCSTYDNGGHIGKLALGHNFKKGSGVKTITKATCTKAGSEKWKCSRCSVYSAEKTVKKTEHLYTVEKVIKAATCTTKKLVHYLCRNCKAEKSGAYYVGETPKHDFETRVIAIKTCTTDGKTRYTCKKCGLVRTTISYKDGHKWYEPTVTAKDIDYNGKCQKFIAEHADCYSGVLCYKKCKICGEYNRSQTYTPKGAHPVHYIDPYIGNCECGVAAAVYPKDCEAILAMTGRYSSLVWGSLKSIIAVLPVNFTVSSFMNLCTNICNNITQAGLEGKMISTKDELIKNLLMGSGMLELQETLKGANLKWLAKGFGTLGSGLSIYQEGKKIAEIYVKSKSYVTTSVDDDPYFLQVSAGTQYGIGATVYYMKSQRSLL